MSSQINNHEKKNDQRIFVANFEYMVHIHMAGCLSESEYQSKIKSGPCYFRFVRICTEAKYLNNLNMSI